MRPKGWGRHHDRAGQQTGSADAGNHGNEDDGVDRPGAEGGDTNVFSQRNVASRPLDDFLLMCTVSAAKAQAECLVLK
jgi:hypothetical protein